MSQDIFVFIEHIRGQVADISFMMLAQARQIADANGGKVVALLAGYKAQGLANDLAANTVLYVDHPSLAEFTGEAYTKAVSGVIKERSPRLVLFGDTSIGVDMAGVLSARLGLPMVSSCQQLSLEGETIHFTGQICAGKIMVEGDLPNGTVLVTMLPGKFKAEQGKSTKAPEIITLPVPALGESRVVFKQYLEPESADVDITKQSVLVSVGRGIQQKDNLDLAEELAEALGTVVAASRPVIDQGWLSTARLVGKSGKAVKPKVYLAFGISGAPEHTEGITGSDMIIAVNTDPAAPIFNYAKYGAEVDLLDLLPVLTEKIREAK
jgi:electron transfer flavoprotein alpha subunit